MNAKCGGIQIFGWLLIIASYSFALLLIRGIFIGLTQGFGGYPNVLWVVMAYLLFFALALYLFAVGRRAISIAKGSPRPRSRVSWGRMLLGSLLMFFTATTQFHLLPGRHSLRQQEYQNQMEVTVRDVMAIAVYIVSGFLIVSGMAKAFHQETAKPDV